MVGITYDHAWLDWIVAVECTLTILKTLCRSFISVNQLDGEQNETIKP